MAKKVEDTTVVATTEEHTLYAHWTIQVYDVTLSSGAGYTATGATSAEYSSNYEFEVQIAKDIPEHRITGCLSMAVK